MADKKIVILRAKIQTDTDHRGKKAGLFCAFFIQSHTYTFLFGFHVYFAFFASKSRLSHLQNYHPLLFCRSGRSTGGYVKSSPSARDLPTCTRTRIAGCFMADVLVSTCPCKERVRFHSHHYSVALRYEQCGSASGSSAAAIRVRIKGAWYYVLRVRKRAFVTYRDNTSAGL